MEKIKISKNKNEVLINFNRQFYNEESIKQAVLDFKDVCDIEEKEEGLLLKPKESKKKVRTVSSADFFIRGLYTATMFSAWGPF